MTVFAKKIAMTHLYNESGKHQAVTVLELLKTKICKMNDQDDKNKKIIYGLFDSGREAKKSVLNQFKTMSQGLNRVVLSIEENNDSEGFKPGDEVTIDKIEKGQDIKVISRSKGKGFAGTVKRHGFNTGPKTHGSHNYRQPGSIGDTNPARVIKGRKMAGHMGSDRITLKGCKVVEVKKEENIIWVRGSVPGANKSIVLVEL